MVTAEKTRARVQMRYGDEQGTHMVNGLLPDITDEQAYATASAMNMVQVNKAAYFHKIEEYKYTW